MTSVIRRPPARRVRPWPLVAVAVLVAAPRPVVPAELARLAGVRTWAVYYGAAPGIAPALSRFDLVVLDPQRHPPLDVVKRRGTRVLMYVSLGEINVHHRYYPGLAGSPCVLAANPNWPEARRLDVRDPTCERWLLTRLVPAALAHPGVDGLFLDTVDAALGLERDDPVRFSGMGAAVERIVLAIRAAHPRALLVMNGGLPLLEGVAGALDGVASESVWTDYGFAERRYLRREAEDAEPRAASLDRVRDRGLSVLTVEYALPVDRAWIEEVVGLARARGFVPYVSTIGLNRVFTHTLPARAASGAAAGR